MGKEIQTQKGETIWITGLHGSGKNELAFTLERKLFENGATCRIIGWKLGKIRA